MDNTQKSRLFGWLGGAAALAVAALLVAGLAATGGVHAQEGGATYTGAIDTLTAECGGGTISLILSADGASVSQFVLDGATVGAVAVNTLSDPPGGPFIVNVSLPISDGSFDAAFQPIEGVDAVAQGTFDGDTVSGSFGVEALACVDVGFTATKAAATTTTDDTTLPTSGTGPMSDSGISLVWALAAGAFGISTLAVGAAARRRVR